MKKIILKKMELENFMGLKKKEVVFNIDQTFIVGENGVGKTTVNTAFRWLLFNKDVKDRKDFEIKTIDSDGLVIHGLEHSVTAWLDVDGKEVVLSKIYKEIWRKKKQVEGKKFSGHETLYYVDSVPVLKKEYDKFLDEMIDENTFKIITDPLYFSEKLHWKAARRLLLEVTGDIKDIEVIGANNVLSKLDLEGKDIESYRKMVRERKKKYNEELERIPVRIDEVSKQIHEYDFDTCNAELIEAKEEFGKLQDELAVGFDEPPERILKKKNLAEVKEQIFDLENEAVTEFNVWKKGLVESKRLIEENIEACDYEIKKSKEKAKAFSEEIQHIEQTLIDLRREWTEIEQSEFNEDIEKKCPVCGQRLPDKEIEVKIEDMRKKFNLDKANGLDYIDRKGHELSKKKSNYELEIRALASKIIEEEAKKEELLKSLEDVKERMSTLKPERKNEEKINELNALRIKLEEELEDNDILEDFKRARYRKMDRKDELDRRIKDLSEIMLHKNINEESKERIEELKRLQKETAQKITAIEKQEYLSDEFIKTKVRLLEDRINKKFKNVSFRLFETQIDNSVVEVCKPLVNGVPFMDANRAGQVNAGIDIINTLTEFYQVTAPIWIDERESITHIIDTKAQVISLVVDPRYKELTVKYKGEKHE